MNRKKNIWGLVLGYIGVLATSYGVLKFYRLFILLKARPARVPWLIFSYWWVAVIPLILMAILGDRWRDYGFTKEKIGRQIGIGLVIALVMSAVLTLLPHLVGLKDWVDNGARSLEAWQVVSEFVYTIFAVAAVEELVFRGFFYRRLELLFDSDIMPIVGSSILFGLFHMYLGNLVQVIVTTLIGILFCVLRKKIKGCTTLSLIVAHGVYDAMISVWAALLCS